MIAAGRLSATLLVALFGASALAVAPQEPGIPLVRQLGSRIAVSKDSLGPRLTLRPLSDGSVLVDDITSKRVLLFDATLSHSLLLIGGTRPPAATYMYYRGSAGLVPYAGDSTILVDGRTGKMIVIEPSGRMGRELVPLDTTSMVSLMVEGDAAIDTAGRTTLRRVRSGFFGPGGEFAYAPSRSKISATGTLDTNVVVRARRGVRSLDTLGLITSPRLQPGIATYDSIGRRLNVPLIDPVRPADAAAIFPNGTVAFIRREDYHIDWVDSDGTRRSTPKIAHEWHKLTPSEKATIVDSTRRWAGAHAGWESLTPMGVPELIRWTVDSIVPPSHVADYLAPFFSGPRVDADGHIWIPQTPDGFIDGLPPNARPPLPGAAIGGGPVYDIVDLHGVLIDRVQLPAGAKLEGFAPAMVFVSWVTGAESTVASYRFK